jgi:hypothetical protein
LYLSKGEIYAKTLFERAKGSALDIIITNRVPASTVMLLSSRTKQIKHLNCSYELLTEVQKFAEATPEPLPLLHTLKIFVAEDDRPDDFDPTISPSPLFFSNAVNLKIVCLDSHPDLSPSPGPFVFPNLVSFDLSTKQFRSFHASRLLDFLEASPMLQMVHIKIIANISLDGIPEERIVVLPNVENLTLTVKDGEGGYKIAAHVSCPSARHTSLTHEKAVFDRITRAVFPDSSLWNTIIRQYSRGPAEEATFEIRNAPVVACKLILRSADAALIELGFNATGELPFFTDVCREIVTQATRTVRDHPQLTNINRLHIRHGFPSTSDPFELRQTAREVGQLFESLGPLDELTIYSCDLLPYLNSFLPEDDIDEPVRFPPIKELTISHTMYPNDQECAAIVGLAKSQHTLGIPLERVVIRRESVFAGMTEGVFAGIKERLKPWVGSVECGYHDLWRTDSIQ